MALRGVEAAGVRGVDIDVRAGEVPASPDWWKRQVEGLAQRPRPAADGCGRGHAERPRRHSRSDADSFAGRRLLSSAGPQERRPQRRSRSPLRALRLQHSCSPNSGCSRQSSHTLRHRRYMVSEQESCSSSWFRQAHDDGKQSSGHVAPSPFAFCPTSSPFTASGSRMLLFHTAIPRHSMPESLRCSTRCTSA